MKRIQQATGHTAYHHVGALGYAPYYEFAGERQRSPGLSWNAGYGGVVPGARVSSSLGAHEIPNLQEMTLGRHTIPYPAFRRTIIHQPFPRGQAAAANRDAAAGAAPVVTQGCFGPVGVGDYIATSDYIATGDYVSPGPMPSSALSGIFDLSDNEKTAVMVAGAAAVGWWLWKRSKKRRSRR